MKRGRGTAFCASSIVSLVSPGENDCDKNKRTAFEGFMRSHIAQRGMEKTFLIGLARVVRPTKQDRSVSHTETAATGRPIRTIPSLRDGRTFESFGLAAMLAIVTAIVAVGYVLVLFAF